MCSSEIYAEGLFTFFDGSQRSACGMVWGISALSNHGPALLWTAGHVVMHLPARCLRCGRPGSMCLCPASILFLNESRS